MDTIKTDELAENPMSRTTGETTDVDAQPAQEAIAQETIAQGVAAESAAEQSVTEAPASAEVGFDEPLDEDEREGSAAGGSGDTGGTTSGIFDGGAAVVGAGLGLASLTGTWLGTVLSARQQLIGQIKTQSGTASSQVAAIYGDPWHTTAVLNGTFALVALLVAGTVLVRQRLGSGPSAAPWVKAVAWGGLVLAVIGLLIAGAIWSDLFTSLPTVPASSGASGPTG
ncbi:hypothetical protein NGB36_01700 [Streptomyces sp. RB6PN25]|uniref:Integral membrane protein n=1 Tax=Streptomyces humicola TaxID=2953240 RepID=A0ABT1PNU7_9ACTN|nr:hypothetical protein [Streptomyces humicola]MCQ4079353.1 hypothetical protein [Streptomyces humicola]